MPEYDVTVPEPGRPVTLKGLKSIVNPGGVGQPRDGDPRAAYMLLDPENLTVTLKRQRYDVARTQELIRRARLPAQMADRLDVRFVGASLPRLAIELGLHELF